MIFVIDSSSLIAFYSVNELNNPDLLHALAKNNKLIIPVAVFEEIKGGRKPTFSILEKAIEEQKIEVSDDITVEETRSFEKRYPRMHKGEIQVLLLGLKLKINSVPYFCIVDEGPARTVAIKNEIALKGTKGLLVLLKELGFIDCGFMESLLYRLDHCNFR